jgi:hypothetical protein
VRFLSLLLFVYRYYPGRWIPIMRSCAEGVFGGARELSVYFLLFFFVDTDDGML